MLGTNVSCHEKHASLWQFLHKLNEAYPDECNLNGIELKVELLIKSFFFWLILKYQIVGNIEERATYNNLQRSYWSIMEPWS